MHEKLAPRRLTSVLFQRYARTIPFPFFPAPWLCRVAKNGGKKKENKKENSWLVVRLIKIENKKIKNKKAKKKLSCAS